jgi:hypothetical protein
MHPLGLMDPNTLILNGELPADEVLQQAILFIDKKLQVKRYFISIILLSKERRKGKK